MENKTQSRKWALVINNPLEAGLDHDAISELLHRCSPAYFCMADEIATTGTPHTHIFLYAPSPVRFSTLKNHFPTAHIEKAYGNASENRAYIRKEGKWAETEKADTVVPDSFMAWGELPAEKEEKAPLMFRLVQCIRAGMSNTEIIDEFPNLAFRIRDIDVLRQTLLAEKYAVENRPLDVSYIYGASGTGKTRGIYQKHDPKSICRITNYRASRGISLTRKVCKRGVLMAKKKPNDYGTGIPLHEVEALARILLPQIQAFFESEEGQKEFAEWKAKQESKTE